MNCCGLKANQLIAHDKTPTVTEQSHERKKKRKGTVVMDRFVSEVERRWYRPVWGNRSTHIQQDALSWRRSQAEICRRTCALRVRLRSRKISLSTDAKPLYAFHCMSRTAFSQGRLMTFRIAGARHAFDSSGLLLSREHRVEILQLAAFGLGEEDIDDRDPGRLLKQR